MKHTREWIQLICRATPGILGVTLVSGCLLRSAAADPLPGQITADPENPGALLRYQGRHIFVCGPGDPEGFLYRGERRADGTRDGDQSELIRRLLEFGGNCIYLQAVRSHGGDGDADHNPFVDNDPSLGVNQAVLAQWETWFKTLDDHGILIYFFLYDDSSDPWKSGDTVGDGEADFVRAMVQAFHHHRNLIWVVAEESEEALSPARAEKLAALIRSEDPHEHLIGNHHHSGIQFKSHRSDSVFDHYAMQLNVDLADVYGQTRKALELADGKYQLIYSENTATPQTVEGWRHHAWMTAMAGGMPMLLGMDIATTPDEALRQCRILSDFFEDTNFPRMQPVAPATPAHPFLLQQEGDSFIAWSKETGMQMVLSGLEKGDYELTWLDCVTGRRIESDMSISEPQTSFPKPASLGVECALYGKRVVPVSEPAPIVFPGKVWERRSPEQVGVDGKALNEFQRIAGGRGCVIKDGYMVHSWGDIERRGDLASASKPIYSHFLFRALELGLLESADDLVARFRPCLADLNAGLEFKDKALTFRHLAFQTACLGYSEPPGSAYDYNDHTMGLFWDLVINDLHRTPWNEAHSLFERELIGPLQLQDGISFPTEGRTRGRPAMSPRDFARFGWLYLNHGQWNGKQLISRRHVELASNDPLPLSIPRTNGFEVERCATRSIGGGGNQADHNGGYSWLWWLNELARDGYSWWKGAPSDLYCALGHCGQRGVAIFPSQQMVVSWNDAKQLHCDRELGSKAFHLLASAVNE